LKELLKTAYLTLSGGRSKGEKFDPMRLADQACREYGKRTDPVHVWRAWHSLPDEEILYKQLHELAEKIKIQREVFTAEERLFAQQCLTGGLNKVLSDLRQGLQKSFKCKF